jgi:hypothetical protein
VDNHDWTKAIRDLICGPSNNDVLTWPHAGGLSTVSQTTCLNGKEGGRSRRKLVMMCSSHVVHKTDRKNINNAIKYFNGM